VNANRSRNVRAAPRQFEYHHSAEAIAYGRDPSIDLRMRHQYVDARARPLAQLGNVVAQFRNAGHDAFAIAGHPTAIHIASKYDEA
jgi:hypothetical protein